MDRLAHTTENKASRIFGILVTFRRPNDLATMLDRLTSQTRQLDLLTVIDNSPNKETAARVDAYRRQRHDVHYLPSHENLGPAGGISLGMRHIMEIAHDEDWVLLLDDDDPPRSNTLIAELADFALQMIEADPATGGVGPRGTRFDRRRARVMKIQESEFGGPVLVDNFGSGKFPMYRIRTIRHVGPFMSELFFGFDDLEFGLRLQDAGYSLYADGDTYLADRQERTSRRRKRPRVRLKDPPSWRRYYSLRNLIYILRQTGHPWTAARITLIRGLAKPLVNLPIQPGLAIRHLRLNWRAARDGWSGTLGRTVEPA